MQRVAGFCALPQVNSSGQKWTAEDNKLYKPITKDIVDCVTHELTLQDVKNDPNWITKPTCIVTSNVDRAIINAEAAKAFSKCKYPFCNGNTNYVLISHSQLKQYYMTKMKDRSFLPILYKEGAFRCWTMHMVMCILVLQMVMHVQCIH
jgi:hypothetical protein